MKSTFPVRPEPVEPRKNVLRQAQGERYKLIITENFIVQKFHPCSFVVSFKIVAAAFLAKVMTALLLSVEL
jgi:hypothetical protein